MHLLVDSRTLLFRLMYIQSKQFMILAPTIREVSTNKAVNAGDKYPHQMYFPALLLIFFKVGIFLYRSRGLRFLFTLKANGWMKSSIRSPDEPKAMSGERTAI